MKNPPAMHIFNRQNNKWPSCDTHTFVLLRYNKVRKYQCWIQTYRRGRSKTGTRTNIFSILINNFKIMTSWVLFRIKLMKYLLLNERKGQTWKWISRFCEFVGYLIILINLNLIRLLTLYYSDPPAASDSSADQLMFHTIVAELGAVSLWKCCSVSVCVRTHQTDITEPAATEANCCVVSCHLCLAQKVALEHTRKTTALVTRQIVLRLVRFYFWPCLYLMV